jgi:hypothetical protein
VEKKEGTPRGPGHFDRWREVCDRWHEVCDAWQDPLLRWHEVCDRWREVCDVWQEPSAEWLPPECTAWGCRAWRRGRAPPEGLAPPPSVASVGQGAAGREAKEPGRGSILLKRPPYHGLPSVGDRGKTWRRGRGLGASPLSGTRRSMWLHAVERGRRREGRRVMGWAWVTHGMGCLFPIAEPCNKVFASVDSPCRVVVS